MKATAAAAVMAFVPACAEAPEPATPPRSWQEVLADLAASRTEALFSFTVLGPLPGNAGLLIAATDQRNDLCREAEGHDDGSRQGWRMHFETSSTAVGDYSVVPDVDYASAVRTAAVSLEQYETGVVVQRRRAISGLLTVDIAPADETDLSTMPKVEVTGTLGFLQRNVQEISCSGVAEIGEVPMVECLCQDESTEFTCLSVDNADCCIDKDAPRDSVVVEVQATHCPNLCRALSLVDIRRCNAL
jgi:hypothetical protein